MIDVVKFESLDSKLIEYKGNIVLIDSDVASLYGVETKEINKAVKNNLDKFPKDYIIELTKEEKLKVVENFHHLTKLKYSPHLPKVFTEKGLYMLATILKGKIATQTTIKIIETFANIKKLSRNLNSISEKQTKQEQNKLVKESNLLLEKVIEIEPTMELKDDETQIETKIELSLGFAKISRIIKTKKKMK